MAEHGTQRPAQPTKRKPGRPRKDDPTAPSFSKKQQALDNNNLSLRKDRKKARGPLFPMPKPTGSGNGQKRPYDLANLVAMRCDGMTHEEIGNYYGKDKATIHEHLKGIWALLDKNNIQAFRERRLELLDASQFEVLNELVRGDKLQKASANNLGYVFTQLHQARRLEAGESTANIGLHAIVEQLEREDRRRRMPGPQDVVIEQESGESEL